MVFLATAVFRATVVNREQAVFLVTLVLAVRLVIQASADTLDIVVFRAIVAFQGFLASRVYLGILDRE